MIPETEEAVTPLQSV